MLVTGYRCEHGGMLSPAKDVSEWRHQKNSLERLTEITEKYLVLKLLQPLTETEALELCKVPKEDLIYETEH